MKRIRYRVPWLTEEIILNVEEHPNGVRLSPVFLSPPPRWHSHVPPRLFGRRFDGLIVGDPAPRQGLLGWLWSWLRRAGR